MSNVSASDIITYGGVPLAVLGVLPTIFTSIRSMKMVRTVRKTLERNGVAALTRSSLLSGILEIEMPRKSIHPLERSDPAYFELSKTASELKGGSYTIFNWKELVVGSKTYRLMYHDELSQPQAEIEFEQLLAFLLDRGAVPSPAGFNDLRTSGLWTPAGTKLLLSPCTADGVLTVSTPDDSDGILSLVLSWCSEWDRRDGDSLPPYWVRVSPGMDYETLGKALKKEEKSEADDALERSEGSGGPQSSMCIRIGLNGIENAYSEDDPKCSLSLLHISSHYGPNASTAFWFACAATAVAAPRGGLWRFTIPEEILSLCARDSVPCGVMVLLALMEEDAVPMWRTPFDTQLENFERQRKIQEQSRLIHQEYRLPPEQRQAAWRARIEKEHFDFHHDHQRKILEQERQREQELREALSSQRLSLAKVAEANRKWLVVNGHINEETSITSVVEQMLFCMVQHEEMAKSIAAMLDRWKNWSDNGGMNKAHFTSVKEEQVSFALASCFLFAIKESSMAAAGGVVADLQECLRIWKKVRLG
ncbi:hypothetical protein M501DRAFT_233033 [Patellaria atrata CBS 101060]|uniref:Uncharacterized protein n=1 Tax=Patellaria atrata CBS 101060 TaxID=1346257 RepID=A0A9P4VQT0_9PEZI|nr:hypothetical protein M501DRAFT_233033 [Patellaria atrata CBS 101060]